MTQPVPEPRQDQPDGAGSDADPSGLRKHLREIVASTKSMSGVFFVLLVLIIVAAGCALLLR